MSVTLLICVSLVLTEAREQVQFFSDFLKCFPEFHIVFHSDSSHNFQYLDEIIQSHKSTYNIYNYEIFRGDYERPNASHILNIILTDSPKIFNRLNSHKIIKHTDIVVTVFRNTTNIPKNILKLTGNVLALDLSTKVQKIYRGCYYCGRKTAHYQLVLETSSKLILNKTTLYLLLLDDFKNLQNHEFRVIFMQYYPFVYCETWNENATFCRKLGGVESLFIETISKKLNFTFTISTLDSSATFFDMIKQIHSKNYDFGIGGISITKDRMPLIQYTMQYNNEDYVFVYLLKLNFREIFNKFVEPFRSYLVWLLYISCYILLSGILYVYNYVHGVKFQDIFWMLFHQPMEQAYHKTKYFSSKTKNSAMFALCSWWSITLVMVTVYKSSVLSSLVHPPNTEPDSFEDLVEAGFCIAGNVNYQDTIYEMLNVNDPVYQKGLRSTTYLPGPCPTLGKILEGNCAMLDELSEIMFELFSICPQVKQMNYEDVRVTRRALRSTKHAWALQNGAPYIQAFDYYINLILSGGLLQKWIANETAKSKRKLFHRSREIREHETRALSLQRFTPILAVFFIGNFTALVTFILEIVLYYLWRPLFHKNII